MEALPAISEVSVAKGFWFVFSAGDHTIRAWGSCITGLERIYVDDAVVSECRRIGRTSTHTFSATGRNYTVVFKNISIMKGQLECSLLSDGKVLKVYLAKYSGPKNFSAMRLAIGGAVGIAIGLLMFFFQLPLWASLGLFALAITANVMTRKKDKGRFSVEEVKAT